jgi:DNA-binding MarR family transcriptional regulator
VVSGEGAIKGADCRAASRYNLLRDEDKLHREARAVPSSYLLLHKGGRPPAEADMQRYFRVTPPSVHQMVLTLELNGFIERIPGQGRSIRLLIPREQLPDLE